MPRSSDVGTQLPAFRILALKSFSQDPSRIPDPVKVTIMLGLKTRSARNSKMLASFHKLRELAILVYLFIFSCSVTGCFRMGLPEHFQGGSEKSALLEPTFRVLVVVSPESEPETSFGNQFVLGVVPLTRIYYQHGANSLLRELAIEILTQEGALVGETSPGNLRLAINTFRPQLIVKPKLVGLSSNAFDLLLARKVSVTGEVILDVLGKNLDSNHEPVVLRHNRSPLSFDEFRSAAQAPVLAYAVEQSLDSALRPLIHAEIERMREFPRQYTGALDTSGTAPPSQPLLVIEPTQLSAQANQQVTSYFGQALSRSYGFDSVPAYSSGVVSRLLNLGIQSGSSSLGIPTLLVNSRFALAKNSGRGAPASGNAPRSWAVKSELTSINYGEKAGKADPRSVTVELLVQLTETANTSSQIGSSETTEVLKRAACKSTVPLDSQHDGALVVAVREAAGEISKSVLEKSELAVCHDVD